MIIETTTFVKILWNTVIVFFSAILAYLEISEEPFTLFAILLIIDYLTGLAKAKILCVSITSNKMKYGIISKLSLLLIPITIAIGAKAIGADSHYILLSGMYILIFSEVYSIIGNIYSIRTRDELPEYDAVASIGKKIRTYLILKSGDKDV
uniref:phage holin family protein n=1 Tax=Aliarcobacter sp. TaxID=2321116 RepID=UPI004047D9CE